MRRLRRVLLLSSALGPAVGGAACGGDAKRAAPASAAAQYEPPASRPKCPRTGHWDACTVRERLDAAGLAPRDTGDSLRPAFMSVAGGRILLGRTELVAFLYPSADAMRRDVDRLDSVFAAPRGQGTVWSGLPTLITSDNLAAVLLGGDAQKVERVTLAITAGPPQPEK